MDATAASAPAIPDPDANATTSQALIDALTAHVALVDRSATIVAVNRAWRQFADANGGCLPEHGIGQNYLALLDGMRRCTPHTAKEVEDATTARRVAAGLRQVLNGDADCFRMEYPCDGPGEAHWFLLTITPLPHAGGLGAVVAHEDLTALRRAQDRALEHSAQLAASFSGTVNAIARFIEKRDPYTAGHQQQVARLCDAIARRLELPDERRQGLLLGASIHDIGKISVPLDILARPGRLSRPEHEIIRAHPQTGCEILEGIDFPWPIADMVHQHHERLDGSGYPQGLAGEAICLEARIICVADVFDAITSHRPYRAARSHAEGVDELLAGRGTRYDSTVVDALLAHLQAPATVAA